MLDLRPVFFVCGLLLITVAVVMAVPAIADFAVGHADWQVFGVSALLTLFVGGLLILMNRTQAPRLTVRQAFLLTVATWTAIAAFGALPFAFSELGMSYTDAFFESMSGITTTGSTVIAGLDEAPPGILLWRSLLQWMGGIGIIAVAIVILPMLQVGGMQLFRMESSDTSEKVMPRVAQIASGIGFCYVTLSAVCALLYWAAGMSAFDAVNHAMTTIATGGYSTSDASIGNYDSAAVDAVATVFMLLGALPFALYVQALRGKPMILLRDSQVRWFLAIVCGGILALTVWVAQIYDISPFLAFRYAAFNVVSIITGTGYSSINYGEWGGFAMAAFFLFMFIGGCAGSTACGIKVFRYQILYETARTQIARLMQPHGVFIPYFNGRPISEEVTSSVMAFFFFFVATFWALTLVLSMLGLDFLTSVSGAAATLANVGPGLGDVIGPAGTFESLPDAAKWVLAAGMLLGRLELYTVLVLFAPTFWRG